MRWCCSPTATASPATAASASWRGINAGDAKGTVALLQEGRADLAWNATPSPTALIERLEQGYGGYLQAARQGDPGAAFEAFNGFRALTAQREGRSA